MYQQHILLKLRNTLNKYHVHWLSSFKHLKLTISIKIPVSYITKFDFMKYAFAKLMVAWLYHFGKKLTDDMVNSLFTSRTCRSCVE